MRKIYLIILRTMLSAVITLCNLIRQLQQLNLKIYILKMKTCPIFQLILQSRHTLMMTIFQIPFQAHLLEKKKRVLGQLPPGQLPPGQLPPDNYPPDNYPPRTNTPGQLPPQITEFPKHKSTKFTSHKVYKSQKVHKLRGQSQNIYEYKFYKIQVSTKVVHGYGKLWSFGGF